jgi:hypothetical protein
MARSTASGEYTSKVRLLSTGAVRVQLMKVVGGAETALTTDAQVSGITYTAGMKLRVRVQATGASPTTVRTKVWVEGTTEPTAWFQTVTDSTSGLQTPGGVGYIVYQSSSATTTLVARFDDLTAVTP